MTITIPPEIEQALARQAAELGTTPELVALTCLREQLLALPAVGSAADRPMTLKEFLQDHIGVLHSSEHQPGGARLSEASGDQFAAILVEKRRREQV